MRNIVSIFLLLIILGSCKRKSQFKVDVSNIQVSVKVNRFDIDFYTATKKTLSDIKKKYPILFPHNDDSVWINKIKNKDEQELFNETQKKFANFTPYERELKRLFQHIKFYNSKFNEPVVITTLTDIDYDNRIIYNGEFLLISLDCYLGANHRFYTDYPEYIKQNNHKKHIIVDVANAIINKQIPPNTKRNFIHKIIYEGKKMYLLDVYLPKISDQEKAGYNAQKYQWALNSEENVWKYFIEKEILYSTDAGLNKRFLNIAPFSKFYSGEDNLSPGRIGVWTGWQIVRSYMKKNNVSLPELLKTEEEEIFKKSKYKPKHKQWP